MKIGILGGSFDPIHNGHLYMAVEARRQYELAEVWLIPNGHAPHKDESGMTPAAARLEMCRLAAVDYDFIKVCDIEVTSEETSYTYRTMEKLHSTYPEHDFYFLMGADSLDYFERWRHPERIAACCHILVINRGDYTEGILQDKILSIQKLFQAEISVVTCEKYDVSSTEIRQNLNLDRVPPSVLEYIRINHLYGLTDL